MKKYLLVIIILVFLAQWLVPANMIWNRERVLLKGNTFRFLTEPVDPEDPIRGRYVRLSFKADTAFMMGHSFIRHDEVYAEIENDNAGYARLKKLHLKPPSGTNNYVKVTIDHWLYDNKTVIIAYPFEEFFLNEYKAPEAETMYRKSTADTAGHTYAMVNIYKGRAVIKDLFINHRSIYTYFR